MIVILSLEEKAMYRVGRSTGYGFKINDEEFASLRASGMTLVEQSLASLNYYHPKDVAELCRRHDVTLWSCHLPFRPCDILDASGLNTSYRRMAFETYCEEIRRGADAGVDKFTFHPGTPFDNEEERPERLRIAMDFADRLAEFAHTQGAVIAVEDMPHCIGNCVEEITAIVGTNDKLRVCFDVNHLLNNTHDEFINRFSDKIITVHFSDYDFIEEKHWFPGEGRIDWIDLMKKLYGAGYKGPWIYECGQRGRNYNMAYNFAAQILRRAGIEEN